jgi:hypothetical protein
MYSSLALLPLPNWERLGIVLRPMDSMSQWSLSHAVRQLSTGPPPVP